MNSNHLQTIFGKKFWLVCIAVGISLFGVVFALSRRADIQNCEQRLTGVMEFIKAQSADYTKYNDTAVAKSLVREAAAVHALEGLSLGCDETALSEYARTLWLTGVSVLNAQGELVCEYTENGTGYAQLQSGIKMEPILSVIDYPQKTYVKRVELGGDIFVNVAVHSCADGTGVVLAYRYIPAEFSQKSVLSIQTLLDGYEISSTGTLLVAEDNRVAASNDPTLIGMNIFESERLMSIRRSGHADKLIRVYAPKGIEQCYGIYSHGRDYYLYAYVPARQVYTLTVMNLVITLVMYILILALVQVFRWNSAKDFFMQQEHSEQEYRKSLEQKNVALQLAVQRETKANLAKREFLFNMSHDIRTPMNAIIGFTALAQTHIDDRGQVEDYLKKISVSSQHLLSLINDVLDMSRIESGKVTLEAKPVHLPELVHELRDIVQAVVSEKDLSLTLDTVGVENEDVIADPLRLEQILINVLANAVKFTPDGGQISLWIVQKDTAPAGVVCSKRLLNQAVGKSLRTHNLKPKKGAQVMRKNEKITALYERLSRDDFGKDDDQQRESNSISNQKAMLEEFAARQGFTNIVHFTDDGISGTCFDRPGFLAMMKEVEAGNVEYLCIKDMSRMGRDYLKVGQIMEILRQRGVRLIAINDGVDSARGDDDFTPFRNIMNEYYARDTSRKIRSTFQSKGKSGKHLTGTVIYGYLWNEARDQWLVDPEAADVVKRIFAMTIEGYGPYQIASKLKEEKVLIPSAYLAQHGEGVNKNKTFKDVYGWGSSTICNILEKREYLGHTINFKTRKHFKDKKSHYVPEDEWTIFENTHEPIIDQQTYALEL